MKVLTLSYDDYANLAFDHTRALRTAGVDALSLKLTAHKFNYEKQADVATVDQIRTACAESDVIVIYHSSPHIRDIVNNFVSKNTEPRAVVAFHTGSLYRQDPSGVKASFDSIPVRRHLTDQCEFLMQSEGSEMIYVASAIDIPAIRANGTFPKIQSRYRIAHYPSKADIKGTETLKQLMQEHGQGFDFWYSEVRVNHREQIIRMSDCDIYLELFQPTLEGKPYGCHGVTAFEAAALGRIVMTQNIYAEAYEKAYGCKSPFLLCNTELDLIKNLKQLQDTSPTGILYLQEQTYRWVNKYHSMEATGERLAKILSEL